MNKVKSSPELLETRGWSKRFVASEPLLSKAADLYRILGYDVHLEPMLKMSEGVSCKAECRICFQEMGVPQMSYVLLSADTQKSR